MAVSKSECLEALSGVIDPELGMSIVDVGLVYRVKPSDDKIEVDFTLTSPGCPLAETIHNDITRVLSEITGVSQVQANLVWNPPWSIDFMSEEARLELGYPI